MLIKSIFIPQKCCFVRGIAIKDRWIFPPKPVDPEVAAAEAKKKIQEEINRANQVSSNIRKQRLEKFRRLPTTEPSEEVMHREYEMPIQPKHPKSLTIALLGVPNSGKSTLVNRLVGSKVSAVSKKSATTVTNKLGIATIGNHQLCFYDTPGILARSKDSISSAWEVVEESDLAVMVMDCVKTVGENELAVLKKLKKMKELEEAPPLCLLLNKYDLWELMPVKDRFPILDRLLLKVPDANELFDSIHQVSALNGHGCKEFESYLISQSKSQPWVFPKDSVTDQSSLELCHELVREKLFRHLNHEIPYLVQIETTGWTELVDGTLRIDQKLYVTKKSHVKLLIGKGGKAIQSIKEEAAYDLQNAFHRPIVLSFEIKVSKYYQSLEEEEYM